MPKAKPKTTTAKPKAAPKPKAEPKKKFVLVSGGKVISVKKKKKT